MMALVPVQKRNLMHELKRKINMKNKLSLLATQPRIDVRTKAPPSLSSIQCFGALSRFICFFNPLA
jgi:hypothetical protein